ncbi:MAG: hypothetical protein HPAVJP_1660 [Candidatus Hepatoplasma vulgare]|nr:MAG: hypothetical protein HPAVJP_1660 [Candidatus Hepatoplasma sp.]
MTTDQIVRIVLKRVDNIIKWNYNYLDESYEIRKEIYKLLNDPVIKAEILNLKKEEVFKNKTDKIEELMEERKKERELLFKKISNARKEYNSNNTTEKTVQINLSDILKEKQHTLEKEILDTKEVENYIKNNGNEHNIKLISQIENKKRELESIQSKLLKSHHNKNEIDKITKIFIELENLFKQLSEENRKEEVNQEEKSTFREKVTSFIKEKILHEEKEESTPEEKQTIPEEKTVVKEKKEVIAHTHKPKKELDIKYHENMNENPEIEQMEKSFKEEVKKDEKIDSSKKEEPKKEEPKKEEPKKEEPKKEEPKKVDEEIKEEKKNKPKDNCEEKDKELEEEKEKEEELKGENSFLKKHLEELKVSIENHRKLKEKFTNSRNEDESKEAEIIENKEKSKKEMEEPKKEEPKKEEPKKEEPKKEEPKKEKTKKEKTKKEKTKKEKTKKEKTKKEKTKKEKSKKEDNKKSKSPNFLEKFEQELKKMSKDLKSGLRKRHFTNTQYKSLIKKYPSLKEIEIKEKNEKIKFKFTRDEKKLLKK